MDNIETSNYSIGVIIARFQVHELHEGHHYVIKQVVQNHKKSIIFLGVPRFIGTKKNPLDFDTRKKMVQTHYPDSVIISLPDQPDNKKWAMELDRRIREVYAHGDVLLYGSRDSFIPYYVNNGGRFQTKELEPLGTFTGTDVRKLISEEVKNSVDFRSGVIYHAYNLFPRVIPTVSICPLSKDKSKILLSKKYGETNLKVITGFVKPEDNNQIDSSIRTYQRETGGLSEISDIKFVSTIKVNDWRFKGEEDTVMTSIYTCQYIKGTITPSDDLIELKWVDIDNIEEEDISDEHSDIIRLIITHLKQIS